MGKRWRHYQVGPYTLGSLKGQAVATWRDDTGARHRNRLGPATSETQARALFNAWIAERNTLKAVASLTVSDIWREYVKDRALDGKQVASLHHHWKALATVFGPLRPASITADLCRYYTQQRLDVGRSAGTAWTELIYLRACLNWACKRRALSETPYVWLPAKPLPKSRILTPDEAQRLIDACVMPHMRLFIILAIATGARSTALLELTWDRVDLELRCIDLNREEQINPLSKAVRKGRAKISYINDWARAALAEAREGRLTDHVIEWNGESVRCIRVGFRAACRRAGIDGVTPHTLRHTAASWLEASDVPMEKIARFLGHANPQITRDTYAKPSVESMRGAAEVVQLPKRLSVQ
jgi:integrase